MLIFYQYEVCVKIGWYYFQLHIQPQQKIKSQHMRSVFALRRFFTTKKYTKSHEWIEFFPTKKIARVGISDHAQQQLGEIIHIEFPTVGKQFEAAQSALVIESVKIAADVYTPVAGKIVTTNSEVEKNPSLVNQNAENSWLFEVSYDKQPGNLLSSEEYKKSYAE